MNAPARLSMREASCQHSPGACAPHEEEDDRRIIWTFLWTLFFFKIGTVVVILWMSGATREANVLLSATTWPFMILPLAAVTGPLIYHYRVRRVRARREALLRSEWMLD